MVLGNFGRIFVLSKEYYVEYLLQKSLVNDVSTDLMGFQKVLNLDIHRILVCDFSHKHVRTRYKNAFICGVLTEQNHLRFVCVLECLKKVKLPINIPYAIHIELSGLLRVITIKTKHEPLYVLRAPGCLDRFAFSFYKAQATIACWNDRRVFECICGKRFDYIGV